MEKREEYKQICFQLQEKQEKLQSLGMDTFVFNPEINTLIDEIGDLEVLKKHLEEELGGAE